MEIKQKLISKNNTNTRPGIKMDPQWITIHETDNTSKGADAEAHARLQASGNSRTASWHYTVDDHEIWQSIPDNEVAWHAGKRIFAPLHRNMRMKTPLIAGKPFTGQSAAKACISLIGKVQRLS